MLILAVDTAGPICAACIYDDVKQVALGSISEDIGRGHAEILPSVVQRALDQAELEFSDLELLSVAEGPGSFAGIRVGISFVRALALTLKIPAVGVSTLIAMAEDAKQENQQILATLDARRGDVFLALLDEGSHILQEPCKLSIEAANDLVGECDFPVCGNGTVNLDIDPDRIVHSNAFVPIEVIAQLAARSDDLTILPKPQYLRAADAKVQTGFALEKI